MVALLGFAPDADPAQPQAILACLNLVPGPRGMKPQRATQPSGAAALPARCLGSAAARLLDDTRRFFAGTETKLYELLATAWTDRSKVGDYSGSADSTWRFSQFGNVTLATNRADVLQASTGTGAIFADAGDAPKASIVETVGDFVMLLNTNDSIYGDSPDRWWCSALGTYDSYAPSIATQAATNRLTDTPGQFRAGRRLGDTMIAYKERSMYEGTYIGPPLIWNWRLVDSKVGAVSQEAVVNLGNSHIFMGADDIYYFDGTRPVRIGTGLVTQWYQTNISPSWLYRAKALHDSTARNIYFFIPDVTGIVGMALVYNYQTRQFGLASNADVTAVVEYVGEGITYDALGDIYPTYDELPDISYDSPFWVSAVELPALFENGTSLVTMTGDAKESSFTTGYTGSNLARQRLSRIHGRYSLYPTVEALASVTLNKTRDLGAGNQGAPKVGALNHSKYDVRAESNWFQPTFNFGAGCDYEMTEYDHVLGGASPR